MSSSLLQRVYITSAIGSSPLVFLPFVDLMLLQVGSSSLDYVLVETRQHAAELLYPLGLWFETLKSKQRVKPY